MALKAIDTLIEDIILLFKQVNNWNNGEFFKLVNEYCTKEGIDPFQLNKSLEHGFHIYLASDSSSESAIRFVINRDYKKIIQ